MSAKDLVIEVVEIKGRCPVYSLGFKFWIKEGFKLYTESPLCMHSVSAIIPYYVALSRGIDPVSLGLSQKENTAYVQCLDPCEYTGGGTVVFAILLPKEGQHEDR